MCCWPGYLGAALLVFGVVLFVALAWHAQRMKREYGPQGHKSEPGHDDTP